MAPRSASSSSPPMPRPRCSSSACTQTRPTEAGFLQRAGSLTMLQIAGSRDRSPRPEGQLAAGAAWQAADQGDREAAPYGGDRVRLMALGSARDALGAASRG